VSVTVDGMAIEQASSTGGFRLFVPVDGSSQSGTVWPKGELEILLDPGKSHQVVLSKPGFRQAVWTVTASAGWKLEKPLEPDSRALRYTGLSLLGGGAGVMAAGGVFLVLSRLDFGVAAPNCLRTPDGKIYCDDAGLSLRAAGHEKAVLGTVLGSLGLLGAVSGGVLVWAPWEKKRDVAVASPVIRAGADGMFISGKLW
jgi:hypothetical protein